MIGRVRKKDQDSNYTGADNERLFIPYEAARKDFPMPGDQYTADSVSTIIAAPRPEVARQLEAWLEREGIGGFLGLEAQGPVEMDIRDDARAAARLRPARPGGAVDVEHGDPGGDVRQDDRRDAHVLRRG